MSQQLFLYKFDKKESKWYLEENRQIVAPVLSMKYVDITGDGIRELVVNSLKGIHVLRVRFSRVISVGCCNIFLYCSIILISCGRN